MKRYMLIQVIEREMTYEFFDALEEAQEKMREQCCNSCTNISDQIDCGDAEINDMNAWVSNGYDDDDYDWWIVDLLE